MTGAHLTARLRSAVQAASGWVVYRDYELVSWLFLRLLGTIYLIVTYGKDIF